MEECGGGVGIVESSVVCVVEVSVKVHLKGVCANISKLIHVDPVVSTQIFFKQKTSGFDQQCGNCTTSLHGTEHILSACKEAQEQDPSCPQTQEIRTTKEVTFCDYLTSEQIVENLPVPKKSAVIATPCVSGCSKAETFKSGSDTDSSDQEDFGYHTEENIDGYANEADFADNEEEVEEEKGEVVKEEKVIEESVLSITSVNELTQEFLENESTKSIEQPVEEEHLGETLVGSLEEVCHACACDSRSPSPTFEEDISYNTDSANTEAQEAKLDFSAPEKQGIEEFSYSARSPKAVMGDEQNAVFTAPLQEYLAAAGLEEAWGYLKVLGCLVVGDLQYLLPGEMDALPLLPRRRLMDHMKTLRLSQPGSPSDASLEQWLSDQGLGHVFGYVYALGAKTTGDIKFLTEEDLKPLPPVSRRRLMVVAVSPPQ